MKKQTERFFSQNLRITIVLFMLTLNTELNYKMQIYETMVDYEYEQKCTTRWEETFYSVK